MHAGLAEAVRLHHLAVLRHACRALDLRRRHQVYLVAVHHHLQQAAHVAVAQHAHPQLPGQRGRVDVLVHAPDGQGPVQVEAVQAGQGGEHLLLPVHRDVAAAALVLEVYVVRLSVAHRLAPADDADGFRALVQHEVEVAVHHLQGEEVRVAGGDPRAVHEQPVLLHRLELEGERAPVEGLVPRGDGEVGLGRGERDGAGLGQLLTLVVDHLARHLHQRMLRARQLRQVHLHAVRFVPHLESSEHSDGHSAWMLLCWFA